MQDTNHMVGQIQRVKGDYLDVKTVKANIKKIKEMKDLRKDYFY